MGDCAAKIVLAPSESELYMCLQAISFLLVLLLLLLLLLLFYFYYYYFYFYYYCFDVTFQSDFAENASTCTIVWHFFSHSLDMLLLSRATTPRS